MVLRLAEVDVSRTITAPELADIPDADIDSTDGVDAPFVRYFDPPGIIPHRLAAAEVGGVQPLRYERKSTAAGRQHRRRR